MTTCTHVLDPSEKRRVGFAQPADSTPWKREPRECPTCGVDFLPRTFHQQFCGRPCALEALRWMWENGLRHPSGAAVLPHLEPSDAEVLRAMDIYRDGHGKLIQSNAHL